MCCVCVCVCVCGGEGGGHLNVQRFKYQDIMRGYEISQWSENEARAKWGMS